MDLEATALSKTGNEERSSCIVNSCDRTLKILKHERKCKKII